MRLSHLDRRWIFVTVFISAVTPLVFHIKLPAAPPTAPVEALYREIVAIPEGATVICSFDFEPGGEVELAPAAVVTVRQLLQKGCKVLTMALWPGGSSEARKYMRLVVDGLRKRGVRKKYGVDYVNLGFKQNNAIVLRQMGAGFSSTFPTDADGTPYDDYEKLPMLAHVNKFRDVAFVLSFSVGTPGLREWVNVVNTQYGTKVGGALTAVSAPEIAPFLASGQLRGAMAGLRGAADYEALVKEPGTATLGMTVQSFVHIAIMGFIVLSNVVYFLERRRAGPRRGKASYG